MFDPHLHKSEETIDSGIRMAPCELCGLWEPVGGMHFMTRREAENLDRMRKVKAEFRSLRQKPDSQTRGESERAEGRISQRERLKALWRELEAERDAAREERMHLLGHTGG